MPDSCRFLVASILGAMLAGCAIVTSERIPLDKPPLVLQEGLQYMLPKAVLPVEVVDSGGSLRVDLKSPVIVGDPAYAYALNPVANAFSADILKLAVDPKTGLLSSVDLDSTDKTGEILKQVFVTRGLRAESADVPAGDQLIFSGFLDPGVNTVAFNQQLDTVVRRYIQSKKAGCSGSLADAEACKAYAALAVPEGSAAYISVSATPLGTVVATQAAVDTPAESAPACGKGICHRGVRPYAITISLLGLTQTTIAQLPNGGAVLSLPLSGQPFVQVKHKLVFVDGMVQGYDSERPSSALAIVSWPLDVYKAVLTATSELLQLKIDTSQKQTAWSQEQLDAATKLKDIADQLEKLRQPQQESATFVSTRSNARSDLLSLRIGVPQRAKVLPSAVPNSPGAGAGAAISGGSDGQLPGGIK